MASQMTENKTQARVRRFVVGLLAAGALLALPVARAAPRKAPSWIPGSLSNYTAEELAELKEVLKEMESFKAAARSYRQTVNSIAGRFTR